MKYFLLGVVVSAFLLTACKPSGPVELTDAEVKPINESAKAWSDGAVAGDWVSVAALYTKDALVKPPNTKAVQGTENIIKLFETFPPVTDMTINNIESKGSGDMAYVYGSYTMTIAPPDTDPVTDSGNYIEIRQKQADGSWLIYRDIFNSELP